MHIMSARSFEQAESSYTSLMLQRLKNACSSFARGETSKYVVPGKELLKAVWKQILLCFKARLESGQRATHFHDADIADILQYLSHAHWIYLQPSMREKLYIGFDFKKGLRALYYDAKVEEKKKAFDAYNNSDDDDFETNFLISNHVIRNLDCDLASDLLRYFVSVFTEEMSIVILGVDIEGNTLQLKELSLAKYIQQYETIKHILETIRDYYVFDLDEKYGSEIHMIECPKKDNLTDVSKLIACMNYYAMEDRQRTACKDIRLFFHQIKNVYIKCKLLEQVVTLSFSNERDLCEFLRDLFSDYINFRPRTNTLSDLMSDLNDIIAKKRIKKVTDATGMTLCCLYFVIASSHSNPNFKSLQLTPSQHEAAKEFAESDLKIEVTDELLAPEMVFLLQKFVTDEMQDE